MTYTHTRIRKFNTRDTYPEQKLDNDLCQAVIAGDTIYLRGQAAQELETNASVAVGDPAGQAEQVMRNVETLLGECDARREHIVKATVYLTDIRYREPVYRVLGHWLKGVFPVFTGVVVAALARPERLVEADVIAVRPAQGAPGTPSDVNAIAEIGLPRRGKCLDHRLRHGGVASRLPAAIASCVSAMACTPSDFVPENPAAPRRRQ